jgi:hypothetical protein
MNKEKRNRIKCPCKNCVCVPVCKHKGYFKLMSCRFLIDYVDLYYRGIHYDCSHRVEIKKILKPTNWDLTESKNVVSEDFPL